MAIAAVGAQMLKADGAERARAGALRRPGSGVSSPSPRLRTSSALGGVWVCAGGCDGLGLGAGECVCV
jgi:hypothetical protein